MRLVRQSLVSSGRKELACSPDLSVCCLCSCHVNIVVSENDVNAAITIAIRLRYDYDPTTTYRARLLPFDAIRRQQKMNLSIFRRSRIVVESLL